MAAGTALSRLTGFARLVALAYALGSTRLADAYNLANTTPNMVYDLVLGGVLSATLIPVFVDRLATRSEEEAWEAISAVSSLVAVVLVGATAVFEALAPLLIHLYTVGNRGGPAEAHAATELLRVFAPQLLLYGGIFLTTALLNTRRRFGAPMFSPVANNILVIAVLVAVPHLARGLSVTTIDAHPGVFWLLAGGTTVGVAAQLVAQLPSMRGAGLRLRWRWDPGHEAVATIVRLSGWTFGFVAANQIALWVVLALANGRSGDASAYIYAWTFFQLPFGVVAVSVMSAIQPDMAEAWALGDVERFRRRLAGGLRSTSAVIVPAAVGYIILAHPIVGLLLQHGRMGASGALTTARILALLSFGLPGFCAYLLLMRAYQAMQDTRTAFFLYLVENGVNVVLAFALYPVMGVRGLAVALAAAYTVATVVAAVDLRRRLSGLEGATLVRYLGRISAAAAAMAVAVALAAAATGSGDDSHRLSQVLAGTAVGLLVYFGVAGLLATAARRRNGRGGG